jgi:thiosulfate/3-mercaptopyruvate sulfurtransferase
MTDLQALLITAPELADLLGLPPDGDSSAATPNPQVRVLDVRWQLGNPNTFAEYQAGHIPGAVFVNLDTQLAAPPTLAAGRHPLPDPAEFQRAVREWGVNDGDTVVAYDGAGNMSSARLWWLLKDVGFADVRLLDGALPAWEAAGLPLETGVVEPEAGSAVLGEPGQLPAIGIDQAAEFPQQGALLDARAKERYLGLTEPIDSRAGHIPGARSAPTGDNLTADGRFRSPEELASRFAALGVDSSAPVATYCGSGVTAAHQVFALARAGFAAALYPGSWSAWSATDRPLETSDETPAQQAGAQ